jgi:hypothetical protein
VKKMNTRPEKIKVVINRSTLEKLIEFADGTEKTFDELIRKIIPKVV